MQDGTLLCPKCGQKVSDIISGLKARNAIFDLRRVRAALLIFGIAISAAGGLYAALDMLAPQSGGLAELSEWHTPAPTSPAAPIGAGEMTTNMASATFEGITFESGASTKPTEEATSISAPDTPTVSESADTDGEQGWQERQDELAQLLRDGESLVLLADSYEQAIRDYPSKPDAYIAFADAYIALGDEDSAADALQRGLDALPDDERIKARLAELDPFEMIVIYDDVFIAPNSEQASEARLQRPIFKPEYKYAEKFNALFGADEGPQNQKQAREHFQSSYDEATMNDTVYINTSDCEATYDNGKIISFCISDVVTGPQPWWHGHYYKYGHTLDIASGVELKLSDVLIDDKDTVGESLAKEFVKQHEAPDGGDWNWNKYDGSYGEDYQILVGTTSLNLPFWLADDGVHIYYDIAVSFNRGYGWRELVIPYYRFDLLRPPFAVQASNWQSAYNVLLQSGEAAIRGFEESHATPSVAVADICGDSTPELLYIVQLYGSYELYVWNWSREKGSKCLLAGKHMGEDAGGGSEFGVVKLENGELLTLYTNAEWWRRWLEYYAFSLQGDSLKQTKALHSLSESIMDEDGSYPDYITGEDGDYIGTYALNGSEITQSEYEYNESQLLASIGTPLIVQGEFFYENGFFNHVSENIAMTYDEAMAHLPRMADATRASDAPIARDFVLPFSGVLPLTEADLSGLTGDELRIARNEIYARYGRQFSDKALQAHFDAKPWYATIQKLPLGSEPKLSKLEMANIDRIKDREALIAN
jgi:hypothetical protein